MSKENDPREEEVAKHSKSEFVAIAITLRAGVRYIRTSVSA